MEDIIIAGAGTAGLSAAIYGVRAGKNVLVLEGGIYGGQIINTPEIANYPGIKQTTGYDFATNLFEQAKDLGTNIAFANITAVQSDTDTITVSTNKDSYSCRTLIVATGAKNRPLGLAKEEQLIGKGISYCATCDGAFFKNKEVAVAGGGNTALEDAIFLSQYCKKVTVIHRRDTFRGESHLVNALKQKQNVHFLLDSRITELHHTERLESISFVNINTNQENELKIDGLFVAIGQEPQNKPFSPPLLLDNYGYIIAGEDCRTNIANIFAAGDCRTKKVRQLATAAADGAVAALAACDYLERR